MASGALHNQRTPLVFGSWMLGGKAIGGGIGYNQDPDQEMLTCSFLGE